MHLMSTTTPDFVAWAVVLYLVLRMLDGGDPRWWLAIGLATGIASEGKWTIGKGTGKAKGLTGGGTFKCSGTQDKLSCEVEGEYPAAPKEAKKDAKK